jgi:mutator protein MutT
MPVIQLAGCIILNSLGKVLLIHRETPPKIQWETPGGKIEPGETPEAAAIRECWEEIGMMPKILKKLGEDNFNEGEKYFHYTWCLAEIGDQEIKITEPNYFNKYDYFSWGEIQNMDDLLSANTKKLVRAYFEKRIEL